MLREQPVDLRRTFRWAVFLVPASALITLAITWSESPPPLSDLLSRLKTWWLAVAIGLAVVPPWMNAIRVWLWLRFVGRPMSPRDALRISLAGEVGAVVLPTNGGGAYVRAGMMIEKGLAPGAAGTLMALWSIQDTAIQAIVVPLALLISGVPAAVPGQIRRVLAGAHHTLLVMAAVASLTVLIGGAVLRWKYLRELLADAMEAGRTIQRKGKTLFALTLGVAGVQCAARYAIMSAVFAALGIAVNPFRALVLQWLVHAAGAITPTPGAAGGTEAGFLLLFGSLIPTSTLSVAVLAWRVLTVHWPLAVGGMVLAILTVTQGRVAGRSYAIQRTSLLSERANGS
jgi:uncharacterized membrane protein YbhN (UPF0104 family)